MFKSEIIRKLRLYPFNIPEASIPKPSAENTIPKKFWIRHCFIELKRFFMFPIFRSLMIKGIVTCSHYVTFSRNEIGYLQ